MKILVLTFTFPPEENGVSNVAYETSLRLSQYGHEIIVGTSYNSMRENKEYPNGIKVEQFNIRGNANCRSYYTGEIDRYLEFIKSFQGDIILCHSWQIWSTDLAFRAFGNLSAKKILISHGLNANSTLGFPRTFLTWLAWKPYLHNIPKMMMGFDKIIYLTDRKNKIVFYDRLIADKKEISNFVIIPNGATPDIFEKQHINFRNIHSIDDKLLILCVSNYDKMKNQEMALKAFMHTRKDNCVLVFIGSKINGYCQKLIRIYNVLRDQTSTGQKVIFLEKQSREEIIAAYRSADIFLFSSKLEAQPLVILDAMASSTPFISTNVGCISEFPGGVITNTETEMKENLISLMEDEKLRVRLGKEGLTAVRNKYNWEQIGLTYNKLMYKVFTNN